LVSFHRFKCRYDTEILLMLMLNTNQLIGVIVW